MVEENAIKKNYLPGLVSVGLIAYLSRVLDPFIKDNWKFGADALHLNYVLIAIIIGMIIKNTLGVPEVLRPGIGLTRPALKVGIVIMGSLYSLRELTRLGLTSTISSVSSRLTDLFVNKDPTTGMSPSTGTRALVPDCWS